MQGAKNGGTSYTEEDGGILNEMLQFTKHKVQTNQADHGWKKRFGQEDCSLRPIGEIQPEHAHSP